ncbi:hypothetical protein, partial [uncultured Cyclobacterium sp.]|uniref:hypothetical protein n=1 Tax=uncultured Cyclobacterium sp. TaxID=453820 RepID=UPI0030EF86FC
RIKSNRQVFNFNYLTLLQRTFLGQLFCPFAVSHSRFLKACFRNRFANVKQNFDVLKHLRENFK